jgi:hypothetical protein
MLGEHPLRNQACGVIAHQAVRVTRLFGLVQPDSGLNRFSLSEVVAELSHRPAGLLDEVLLPEPVGEKRPRSLRCARIAILPPLVDLLADLRDQRRHQLRCLIEVKLLGTGIPAVSRVDHGERVAREVGVNRHVRTPSPR